MGCHIGSAFAWPYDRVTLHKEAPSMIDAQMPEPIPPAVPPMPPPYDDPDGLPPNPVELPPPGGDPDPDIEPPTPLRLMQRNASPSQKHMVH